MNTSCCVRLGFTTFLSLCLGGSALAQPSGEAPFTRDERRRLIAGELVQRNMSERGENGTTMYGGTSWIRVDAPVERVWAMVSDAANMPRLVPSLDRVRVIEHEVDNNDETRLVWVHHSMTILEAAYYTRMTLDHETHSLRFRLDRSRPHSTIEGGRGFLSLSSYGGDTIVTWGMVADPGSGMIAQVFGPMLSELLLLPPQCVHDRMEGVPNDRCGP